MATASVPSMIARELALSRLLKTYILSGLFFMLFPGTFIGVWNLISISAARSPGFASDAWVQAHGHAQIFGWIGSFILGIGFYSLPKMRGERGDAGRLGWTCWGLWTTGVLLRWCVNLWPWGWRLLLPLSAVLELTAFLLFYRAVSGHSAPDRGKRRFENWIVLVIAATLGLLATTIINLGGTIYVAARLSSPVFPPVFNQRLLTLAVWGALVPLVWGFSARWMPVFLGLGSPRQRMLVLALAANSAGVATALGGRPAASAALLLAGAVCSVAGLRLFEPTEQPPKIRGVHRSFPLFIRLAYVWLLVSAALALWAMWQAPAPGVWGASRHAVTVGFLSTMVFSVGSRVLPAFAGVKQLYSSGLMLLSLALLSAGCLLRVTAEISAYEGFAGEAWSWLPVSAVVELTAVTVFAFNMAFTFAARARTEG